MIGESARELLCLAMRLQVCLKSRQVTYVIYWCCVLVSSGQQSAIMGFIRTLGFTRRIKVAVIARQDLVAPAAVDLALLGKSRQLP